MGSGQVKNLVPGGEGNNFGGSRLKFHPPLDVIILGLLLSIFVACCLICKFQWRFIIYGQDCKGTGHFEGYGTYFRHKHFRQVTSKWALFCPGQAQILKISDPSHKLWTIQKNEYYRSMRDSNTHKPRPLFRRQLACWPHNVLPVKL